MTTSLPLSKALFEKGLKIETEKIWVKINDVTDNNKEKWITSFRLWSGAIPHENCLAYSTDELLAVMPDRIEIERYNFNFYVYIPEFRHREKDTNLPEALGLMVKWLLENGYEWDVESKMRRED